MSEYKPITQGLRNLINIDAALLGMSTSMVTVLICECDNIDAIHKALEDENAEMRPFVESLEEAAENREAVTLWGVDYIAGPVDKYGTPISMSSYFDGERGFPTSVWYHADTGCWYVNFSKDGPIKAEECVVVRKPSVMSLLDELLVKWPDCEGPVEELALKKRIASCLQIAEVAE